MPAGSSSWVPPPDLAHRGLPHAEPVGDGLRVQILGHQGGSRRGPGRQPPTSGSPTSSPGSREARSCSRSRSSCSWDVLSVAAGWGFGGAVIWRAMDSHSPSRRCPSCWVCRRARLAAAIRMLWWNAANSETAGCSMNSTSRSGVSRCWTSPCQRLATSPGDTGRSSRLDNSKARWRNPLLHGPFLPTTATSRCGSPARSVGPNSAGCCGRCPPSCATTLVRGRSWGPPELGGQLGAVGCRGSLDTARPALDADRVDPRLQRAQRLDRAGRLRQ